MTGESLPGVTVLEEGAPAVVVEIAAAPAPVTVITLPAGVGASAYDLWLASGHTGTVEDFLASLRASGEGGGPAALLWTQAEPLAVWSIPHTLGSYPDVHTYDSAGEQVYGQVHHEPGLVTVTFGAPFSGTARLS